MCFLGSAYPTISTDRILVKGTSYPEYVIRLTFVFKFATPSSPEVVFNFNNAQTANQPDNSTVLLPA